MVDLSFLSRVLFLLMLLRPITAEDDQLVHHQVMGMSLHTFANVSEASPSSITQRRMLKDQDMKDVQDVLKYNILGVSLDDGKIMRFQARFRNDEHWYGDCIDDSGASANFIVSRGQGNQAPRLIGSIRTESGDAQYRISMNESKGLMALITDGAGTLPERVLQPQDDELPEEGSEQVGSSYSMSQLSSDESLSIDEDAIVRVDIMVAYTRNAMCTAASRDFPCANSKENRQKILDIIEEEIAKTNLAFQLSRVTARLNLVKTWMDEDYDEERDADSDYRTILDHLTYDDDGYLDDVHDVRDEYGADLVAMMVDSSELCGIAWLYSSSRKAFSLTSWFCNTFVFAHEIGHNMGCYHNREDSNIGQHPYAHGYQDEQSRYRTVMSYQCDFQSCPRVPYFSNPNLLYFNNRGAPVGTPEENCSLELNRLAPRIANYRDEKEPDDIDDDDDNDAKGDDDDSKSSKEDDDDSKSSKGDDDDDDDGSKPSKSGKSSKYASSKGGKYSSKGSSKYSKSDKGSGGKGKGNSGSNSRRLRFVPYKK